MRFVWAVAAFVLAALMIAGGVAQRTVFEGPKTETTTVHQQQAAPFTVIDGAVLGRLPGSQTLRVSGNGEVFTAYGRTADMTAWLADAPYNHVTLTKSGHVQTRLVEPSATPEPADATRDPNGSDLWLEQNRQRGTIVDRLQLPDAMSVLVASDGTRPAPTDVTITWPVHRTTPWAGPLIVGGIIVLAVGVFLYILGLRAARRSRGPRRKAAPPLPDGPSSEDLAEEAADKGVISAGAPRRREGTRRRMMVGLPLVLVGSIALAGCSADAWPQFASSPTPSPTRTVVTPADQQRPAVSTAQAGRILARIAQTVSTADEKKDATLAATRLDGPALTERETNYALRAKLPTQKPLAAIPAAGLKVVLPQAYDGWPRTVMLVTEQKADKAAAATSTIMMMQQHDPWSPYKLAYVGQLAVDKLPDVAPAYVGATAVQPDSSFLSMAPQEIAAAYADLIDKGSASSFAGDFDTAHDVFLTGVTKDRSARLAAFEKSAQKKTGTLTFSAQAGPQPPLALATLESGAIVAVNVNEIDTVKPVGSDAVIKLGDERVKAMTGVAQSQTGFTTTYSDQLFFYVPGAGAGDARAMLLGYASNFLGAKVIGK